MAGKDISINAPKSAYEALVRAVAPGVALADVTDVSLNGDFCKVEYRDRARATQFDPSPVSVSTAKVK